MQQLNHPNPKLSGRNYYYILTEYFSSLIFCTYFEARCSSARESDLPILTDQVNIPTSFGMFGRAAVDNAGSVFSWKLRICHYDL